VPEDTICYRITSYNEKAYVLRVDAVVVVWRHPASLQEESICFDLTGQKIQSREKRFKK
jgi:hypothetical protein